MTADPATDTWKLNGVIVDKDVDYSILGQFLILSVSPSTDIFSLQEQIRRRPEVSTPNFHLWRLLKDVPTVASPLTISRTIAGFSFPDHEKEEQVTNEDVELLNTFKLVSYHWTTPPESEYVHIVVCVTTGQADAGHPGVKRQRDAEDGDDIEVLKRLKSTIRKDSPSSLSDPVKFQEMVGTGQFIACNRPFEKYTIPLTLLHQAFGIFKDRCRAAPSDRALDCLFELVSRACDWFPDESRRRDTIADILGDHLGLHLHEEKVPNTDYTTEILPVTTGIMPPLVRACKNEKGTPINQVIMYYGNYLVNALENYSKHNTCFPCILIVDMGSQLSFYGAAWDGQRIRVEPLTRGLDLTIHCKEKRERDEIASTLDALIETVQYIREHYESIKAAAKTWNNHRRQYPFLSSYRDNEQEVSFTYNTQLSLDKLVFSVTVDHPDSGARECIVKFTNQYSEAAHNYLARRGYAPRLRQSIRISADWTAIVMDKPEYQTLHDLLPLSHAKEKQEKVQYKVQEIIQTLHRGGFVHGDIRASNVLVDPASFESGDLVVHLIDFDWAGRFGEARYPAGVNCRTVLRPKGVKGGELITMPHDFEMATHLFQYVPILWSS